MLSEQLADARFCGHLTPPSGHLAIWPFFIWDYFFAEIAVSCGRCGSALTAQASRPAGMMV